MRLDGDMLIAVAESSFARYLWHARILVYVIIAAFVVFAAIHGDSLFVAGNLHDVFIWLNSAYFVESGLRPNSDFSSPLGPLYIYLNYFAWRMLDRVSDMPLLLGGIVFLVICALVLLVRRLLNREFLPDFVFFCFLLLMSGRQFGAGPKIVNWYGNYNRFGWAFLLFLVALLLSRKEALLRPTERQKTCVAAVAGTVLALLFLIKVSFFAAAGIVYLGWLVAACRLRDFRVLIVPAAIVGAAAATAHLTAADIPDYVADILGAAKARASGEGARLNVLDFLTATGFVAANLLIDRWADPAVPFNFKRSFFWASTGLAILLAISADFGKPLIFFGIILSARALNLHEELVARLRRTMAPTTALVFLLPVFLISFILIESASVIVSAGWKLGLSDMENVQRIVWRQSDGDPKTLDFLVPIDDKFPGFAKLAEIIDASPDRDTLFEEISKIEGGAFRYDNSTYVAMLNEAIEVVRTSGNADRHVLAIEFTNPLPLLLSAPPPIGAPLWLHEGTTIAETDLHALDPALAAADVVLVPHVTIDALSRSRTNAMFTRFNAEHGRFCKLHVGKFWAFYKLC